MSESTAAAQILVDAFTRINERVHGTLDGLPYDQLVARLDPEANSIAWLLWHVVRIQDDHVAHVAGRPQAWTQEGWAERFGLPFDDGAVGYGQSSEEVAAVQSPPELLLGYADAVHERTVAFVAGVTEEDLARVVDDAWDPPVTMSVRLVSVLGDNWQHVGQAAFIRGVLDRLAD